MSSWGPPGVLGIWGEGLFIFRELGSTANYFRGAGEQTHTFGDLGSTAKSKKNKYQASILSDSLKCCRLLGGYRPQTPMHQCNFISISIHKLSQKIYINNDIMESFLFWNIPLDNLEGGLGS